MRDSGVLTSSPWWRSASVWHRVSLLVGALLIGALLVSGSFVVTRMRETYVLETRVNQLEGSVRSMLLQRTMLVTDFDARLDMLERTVFGDVIPKVDRAHPDGVPVSRIEQILFRNDRELRDRVERLERWRLVMTK